MRVDTALATARAALTQSPTAMLDAELLLAHALGRGRTWLHAWPESELATTTRDDFEALIARRAAGEPVAYLLGEREFWSMAFTVTPDILIPRPETETLVALALEHFTKNAIAHPRIVDLGTGSGCVAIALAHERPDATISAVEQSTATLALARRNAERHGAAIEWLQGNWFEPLATRRFEAIVANPPYVASDDPHLQQGDVRFEPIAALDGGADGLDALRAIIARAPHHLVAGGMLAIEHGADQAESVAAQFQQAGYQQIHTHPDAAELARVTTGLALKQPAA